MDAGASVDVETPSPSSPDITGVNIETQNWTALTYAVAKGNLICADILLKRGADVEGGAKSEFKYILTPLQVSFVNTYENAFFHSDKILTVLFRR